LSGPDYPGYVTVISFCVVAGLLELFEAFAGTWGVQGRGGSALAGFAALVGGIVGILAGSALIPVPVVGSVLAMMAGGFLFAYLVEYVRLKKVSHAAHIAWGAVVGRVVVIFAKVMATLGMIGWLAAGMMVEAMD
jgi:uncharacterized protein YqgC (DUF456 family)